MRNADAYERRYLAGDDVFFRDRVGLRDAWPTLRWQVALGLGALFGFAIWKMGAFGLVFSLGASALAGASLVLRVDPTPDAATAPIESSAAVSPAAKTHP